MYGYNPQVTGNARITAPGSGGYNPTVVHHQQPQAVIITNPHPVMMMNQIQHHPVMMNNNNMIPNNSNMMMTVNNNLNPNSNHHMILNNPNIMNMNNNIPNNSNSNSNVINSVTTTSNNGQPPQFFPEVVRLSTAQAELILSNPVELDSFFESLEYVKGTRTQRIKQRDHVETIAINNLTHEKELNDLKNTVTSLQLNIREKYRVIESKIQKQQAILAQYSNEGINDKLKKASEEAERESDEMGEKFRSGSNNLSSNSTLNCNDFIKEYMAKRKLHHLRAARYEYSQIHQP